jgi:hypothetical protein
MQVGRAHVGVTRQHRLHYRIVGSQELFFFERATELDSLCAESRAHHQVARRTLAIDPRRADAHEIRRPYDGRAQNDEIPRRTGNAMGRARPPPAARMATSGGSQATSTLPSYIAASRLG